jgi:hypothetical protein
VLYNGHLLREDRQPAGVRTEVIRQTRHERRVLRFLTLDRLF